MARSIDEVNITNFVNTGQTTAMPRFTFDLQIRYTSDNGTKQTHNQSYIFPNDLSSMPLNVRRAFAEQMIHAVARVALGIDTWEKYA